MASYAELLGAHDPNQMVMDRIQAGPPEQVFSEESLMLVATGTRRDENDVVLGREWCPAPPLRPNP